MATLLEEGPSATPDGDDEDGDSKKLALADADYEPNYDEDNFSDTFSDLGVGWPTNDDQRMMKTTPATRPGPRRVVDNDEADADADFGEPVHKKRRRAVTTASKPRTMDSITIAKPRTMDSITTAKPRTMDSITNARRKEARTYRKEGETHTCLVSWVICFSRWDGMEGGTYSLLHLLVVVLFT